MINWLQDWFSTHCDGDWEHERGIKIETVDNPGWNIEIDFNDTGINRKNLDWELFEVSEKNWFGFRIEENVFYASGDPSKFNIILEIFREIIENESLKDTFVKSIVNE